MQTYGFTIILYQLALGIVEVQRLGGLLRNEHHIETTLFQHTRELTATLAKGHGTRGVVVGNIDGGILTLLVVVVRALVLIELEMAILAGIDIEIDEIGRTLVRVLHLRTERNDAALTHKDGDTLVGGVDYHLTI